MWVPVALDPGEGAYRQLADQLAVYLGAPGYGEIFSELGYGDLVQCARSGAPRREVADGVPRELVEAVCAVGGTHDISARVDDYRQAGADHIGIAPSTAEDPAGRRALEALLRTAREDPSETKPNERTGAWRKTPRVKRARVRGRQQ